MASRVSADIEPPVVVHAEEKRRIDRPALDGLAQDRGCAGFGEKLEPAWRLDADDPDYWRRGEVARRAARAARD